MDNNELVVGIADIKIGESPQKVKTNLGSCVAVCLYCPEKKVGGMLHLMLSSSKGSYGKGVLKREKYADTGIEELLVKLKKKYGVLPAILKAKIFGGAKVLKAVQQNIGAENVGAVRSILKNEGIPIIASQVGGEKGYKVHMDLTTGKVICQIFGEEAKEY